MHKSKLTPEIIERIKQEYKTTNKIRETHRNLKSVFEWLTFHNVRDVVNAMKWEVYNIQNTFQETMEEHWFLKHDWNHWWLKVDWASIHIKNDIKFNQEEFIEWMLEEIRKHSIKYEKFEYITDENDYLMIIDFADFHFWKYASPEETVNQYNLDIATDRFEKWIDWILNKSKCWNKDQFIFVIWNDILHIDTPRRTTTSWTPQDTHWMWFEAFNRAKDCYIKAIEKLQTIAPIHVIHNPSNHDYMSWRFLAQTIKAWFHKNENITWDIWIKHRKYTKYWKNMLWFSHWDWAKESDLPLLMATEAPELRSNSKYRYIYLHHKHHKIAKEYNGISIEYVRSWSWTDSWHDRNWYTTIPAVDWFILDKEYWQIARLTHYFEKTNDKVPNSNLDLTPKKHNEKK